MTKYAQGKHALPRYPRGKHSIERFSTDECGGAHLLGCRIRREACRHSMSAIAFLLASGLSVNALGVPVRALADELSAVPEARDREIAPEGAELVFDESTGLLVDPVTGKAYDPVTRCLISDDASMANDPSQRPAGGQSADQGTAGGEAPAEDASTPTQGKVPDTPEAADSELAGGSEESMPPDPTTIDEPEGVQAVDAVASQEQLAATPLEQQVVEDAPATAAGSWTGVVEDGSTVDSVITELRVAARLLDAGWTPEMVAAALGNAFAESGSDASSFSDMCGMFNCPYEVAGGLFQWTDAGASAASLACSGFTSLRQYAEAQGKPWNDVDVQVEYFLETWRDDWIARQNAYDDCCPAYAGVDVSLEAFDESAGDDFDGDGIIDSRDSDIDGDGIPNERDIINAQVIDGTVQFFSIGIVSNEPEPRAQHSKEEGERRVAELTFAFMAGYEGPAAEAAHFDRRLAHAQRMYHAVLALDESFDQDVMSKDASVVVASAEAMLGGSYVWAAETPGTKVFDCSGLTKWCYSLIGVDLDHYSESQYAQADRVYAVEDAVPGDILWKPGHVGIYIGNGRTVEAKGTNYGIVYGDASTFEAALHFNELDRFTEETRARNERVQKSIQSMKELLL